MHQQMIGSASMEASGPDLPLVPAAVSIAESGGARTWRRAGSAADILGIFAKPLWAGVLVTVVALLQAIYNGTLPLYVDEAYYWMWSRHLALSYFDHPPMIAWMIALATHFASNEFMVRLVSVVCLSLSAWVLYRLARKLYDGRTAGIALLIFLAIPVVQMGYMLATPDAPQILFWTLALYASHQAIFEEGKASYLATGVWIGLGLLSKYTAILFPASLLIFVLLRRPRILATWPAWAAMAVALLVFSPVLIWNAQHGWISFGFQYNHGTSHDDTLHLGHFFEFLGGLFGVFSPVFFVLLLMALIALFRRRPDDKSLFVALFAVVPLLFFMYKGLYKKMELNWVAMAFLAGTLIVADYVVRRRLYKTFWLGLGLAVLLDVAIKFPLALPLPPAWNIQHRLDGFREASMELLRYRQPGDALYGDYLTTASILSFYAPGHPDATVPTASRFSQYDLWRKEGLAPSGPGLYLATAHKGSELKAACRTSRLLETYVYHFEDSGTKTFYLYRCDAKGAAT